MLEKPDLLKFQVVNPNEADGVPSADKGLSIVGPEIADAAIQTLKDDASQVRVVIQGANFRGGAGTGSLEELSINARSAKTVFGPAPTIRRSSTRLASSRLESCTR